MFFFLWKYGESLEEYFAQEICLEEDKLLMQNSKIIGFHPQLPLKALTLLREPKVTP